MKDISGKVVLITGGGHGIGRETAIAFAREGARVAIADVNDAWLEETLAELKKVSPDAMGIRADLRDREHVFDMVDRVESEMGSVDILINNAGVVHTRLFYELDENQISDMIDVDLLAPIWACKRAIPGMLRRGYGHIVNVASVAGKSTNPYLSVYCAAKFGLVGFTDTLHQELAHRGIETTLVNPGWVASGMFSGAKRVALLTKWISPGDVAAAILKGVKESRAEIHVPRSMWFAGFLRVILGQKIMTKLWRVFRGDSLFAEVKGHGGSMDKSALK